MGALSEQDQILRDLGGRLCECSPATTGHMPMPLAPAGSCPNCSATGPLYTQALEHAKLGGRVNGLFGVPDLDEPIPHHLTDKALAITNGSGDREPPGTTWKPVDLSVVLAGAYEAPRPSIGCRDDGKGLFYPGRMHSVAAETESGKTWFALLASMSEIAKGSNVLYLDFEDDEGGIVTRLMSMGAEVAAIRDHFVYVKPEEPVTSEALSALLEDFKPSLVIIDGMTEAMSLHGFDPLVNKDTADFGRLIPKRCAKSGAAVVIMDHVVKDKEQRNGNAIGAVHKVNGLNGAMYILENAEPFGIGIEGRSQVLIRKDRPGQLRRHAVPGKGKFFHYCDLVVKSHDESFAECSLAVPLKPEGTVSTKPVALMRKISRALEESPEGKTGRGIRGAVGGRTENVIDALETLVSTGFVSSEKHGNSVTYKSVMPFAA